MQKQSKIFLLFCLCLMFLPNLVNAETYDAYFVETNEYNDVINQNDNQTTVGQVKRYAYNADQNFVQMNANVNYQAYYDYTGIVKCISDSLLYDYSTNEFKNGKHISIQDNLNPKTIRLIPNILTNYAANMSFSSIFYLNDSSITSFRFYFISGSYEYIYTIEFNGLTQLRIRIVNSTTITNSEWTTINRSYPVKIAITTDSANNKIYGNLFSLYDNTTININCLETANFASSYYFLMRFYASTDITSKIDILAIDSNRVLREKFNYIDNEEDLDISYTDNRILEMYDVIDESYDLADYGVINEYIPNFQSYYNQSTYFDVEPWNNDYLNPISTYTIDYRFDASKKRFREIGAWECQQKDASELSKIVFKNETVLTDSDSFSQLIVFSIENIECYPIIFNFLINEDNYGFTLEYYDKILYLFKTSYVDGVYDAHILLEQLNIASYCSYQNEFLFFISGYQLGLNFYFSYTLMINQIETWFELDVLEDCVNTFTGINDSVMLITDLDDNILRLLHPFNTSLLNRPFDFILKCFFVSDEYKLSITDFNEVWKSIDYRCFSEGYEFELEFEGFNQFLNHNITDYLLYYLVVNISVESTEIMFDLVIHSIFALSEFYNESNYIVNYTVDELTQDLTIFFLYITLFTDYINNSIDISINFTEYWLINWEIVEVGWFSVLMKGIAPLSIIVVFAVAGYHFFKIKGVICAIALSFIVLYFMSMINLVSAIMLVVVMIVMLIYNIKRKGANIDV